MIKTYLKNFRRRTPSVRSVTAAIPHRGCLSTESLTEPSTTILPETAGGIQPKNLLFGTSPEISHADGKYGVKGVRQVDSNFHAD